MKTALPLFMMLAALPLACCGRPQTVSDFKTALVRLSVAGDQDRTQLSAYQSLLLDAQAKFELAKKDLGGETVLLSGLLGFGRERFRIAAFAGVKDRQWRAWF